MPPQWIRCISIQTYPNILHLSQNLHLSNFTTIPQPSVPLQIKWLEEFIVDGITFSTFLFYLHSPANQIVPTIVLKQFILRSPMISVLPIPTLSSFYSPSQQNFTQLTTLLLNRTLYSFGFLTPPIVTFILPHWSILSFLNQLICCDPWHVNEIRLCLQLYQILSEKCNLVLW